MILILLWSTQQPFPFSHHLSKLPFYLFLLKIIGHNKLFIIVRLKCLRRKRHYLQCKRRHLSSHRRFWARNDWPLGRHRDRIIILRSFYKLWNPRQIKLKYVLVLLPFQILAKQICLWFQLVQKFPHFLLLLWRQLKLLYCPRLEQSPCFEPTISLSLNKLVNIGDIVYLVHFEQKFELLNC